LTEQSIETLSKEVSIARTRHNILKIGFWTASVAFVAYAVYSASFVLFQANVIGPLLGNGLGYLSSLIIATPFLLAMLALHYTVPEEKKFWTNGALVLAVIYTTYVSINYVVQLTTVIPAGYIWTVADQAGTPGALSLLNQTPHSLLWDFDGLGYIFMSLAAVFAFPVFEKNGLQKWLRYFFLANALNVPLFAIEYYYPNFSAVMWVATPGGIIAPGSVLLLALFFRKQLSNSFSSPIDSPSRKAYFGK
jgi:hypothetical protein